MKEQKTPGYLVGYMLSAIILGCLACCIGGIAISLTLKFLLWIF